MFGFQPYLTCECGNQIGLPLTIQAEKSRHQIPWPGGWPDRSVRCPSCRRAFAYSSMELNRRPIETLEDLELIRGSEVRRLSYPCVESACSGRVVVLFVAKRDSLRTQDILVIEKTSFSGLPCTIAPHPNNPRGIGIGEIESGPDPDWPKG